MVEAEKEVEHTGFYFPIWEQVRAVSPERIICIVERALHVVTDSAQSFVIELGCKVFGAKHSIL